MQFGRAPLIRGATLGEASTALVAPAQNDKPPRACHGRRGLLRVPRVAVHLPPPRMLASHQHASAPAGATYTRFDRTNAPCPPCGPALGEATATAQDHRPPPPPPAATPAARLPRRRSHRSGATLPPLRLPPHASRLCRRSRPDGSARPCPPPSLLEEQRVGYAAHPHASRRGGGGWSLFHLTAARRRRRCGGCCCGHAIAPPPRGVVAAAWRPYGGCSGGGGSGGQLAG